MEASGTAAAISTGGASGGTTNAPSVGATAPTPSAGATLQSVPAGAEWFKEFKNSDLKSYITEKKFSDPEQLAQSYWNLEKLKGVPEDRLLKLPEKMEGADARAIYERLGAPKEAKGYELPRDEKTDIKFVDSAESAFYENGLTKTQASGILKSFNEFAKLQTETQRELQNHAILQADVKLKNEWGAAYDSNVNLVRQGAKILGLDAKTLDIMESVQGREALFKTLQRIGVGVGESNFVDGSSTQTPAMTAEQAHEEIKKLIKDNKFSKKVARGDMEATARWNELNRLAAPGDKQII